MKNFKVYLNSSREPKTWIVMNKHITLENGFNCHSGEFKNQDTANLFCEWLNNALGGLDE